MARAYCPSCGRRYNGKRCSNCLYENFTEEIAHGLHTHEGEPLVVEAPERKPIRPKDPFGCDKKTRKPSIRLGVVILVMLLALLGPVLSAVFSLISEVGSAVSGFTSEAEAEPALPADGTTLYDADGLTVVADWRDGQECKDGFRVVVQNNTGRDITVSSRDILVNGYLMEDSLLYCQAEAGHAAEDWFILSQSDLANAGIETVQELSLTLVAYDAETYETLVQTGFLPLRTSAVLSQIVDDSGVLLFEQDGIRVVFRGYVPSEYAPEEATNGTLQFFLENETDQYLDYYTTECQVNGERVILSLWCALPPHSRAVRGIYLYSLEELGITSREDVTEMVITLGLCTHDEYDPFLQTGPLSVPFDRDVQK